jgi:hypothetical protein
MFRLFPLNYTSELQLYHSSTLLYLNFFGFEFSEIFVFENRLPASVSRGVDKFAWNIHFFQTFK